MDINIILLIVIFFIGYVLGAYSSICVSTYINPKKNEKSYINNKPTNNKSYNTSEQSGGNKKNNLFQELIPNITEDITLQPFNNSNMEQYKII
tara:strand:- start:2261 stop:2539 length:279 start_codon:yes stop_codon:yes gene_type:complete